MAEKISKTQIDRLGERLKKGDISEADLRLLDSYRRSLASAYEAVVGTISKEMGLEPTGRPAKSTTSIIEKLRRESIRLTQIQDVAGCRIIVADIAAQEKTVQALTSAYAQTDVVDRRQRPSHGYRAVHVIVSHDGKLVEIQVRTQLQHLWAEFSEKLSDIIDPAIKYGGGDARIQEMLTESSTLVLSQEELETKLPTLALLGSKPDVSDAEKQELYDIQAGVIQLRQKVLSHLQADVERAEQLKGDDNALSD